MDESVEVRPVPGYEGHYEVDSLGNVFSLKRGRRKQMRLAPNGGGYLQTQLFLNGAFKTLGAHMLVAMAFHSHKSCGQLIEVDHFDKDKTNNKASNLRIITHPHNCLHRRVSVRSKSGVNGVTWMKQGKCWVANIRADWNLIYLGCFKNLADAIEARRRAEALRIDELLALRDSIRAKKLEKVIDAAA